MYPGLQIYESTSELQSVSLSESESAESESAESESESAKAESESAKAESESAKAESESEDAAPADGRALIGLLASSSFANPNYQQRVLERIGSSEVKAMISSFVTPAMMVTLEPSLRELAFRLMLLCEQVYARMDESHWKRSHAEARALCAAWVEVGKQCGGGWGDAAPSLSGFRKEIRDVQSRLRHPATPWSSNQLDAVEDVVKRLRLLRGSFCVKTLRKLDPRLHAVGTDDIVASFLAAPRLIKLAQRALHVFRSRLPPNFGIVRAEVAKEADKYGPADMPQYSPAELGACFSLCCDELHMFGPSVLENAVCSSAYASVCYVLQNLEWLSASATRSLGWFSCVVM